MSVLGYKNRVAQPASRPAPSTDLWATHPAMFAAYDQRFGFTVDVAAIATNAKCARFYTPAEDGLRQSWAAERVWCNPPYSRIGPWVRKAWAETSADVIVMLVPANRTEQGWWQQLVEPYRDQQAGHLQVEFLPGRQRFIRDGQMAIRRGEHPRPPFGCCLLIWPGPHRDQPAEAWNRNGEADLFGGAA